jgi:branched-chain amino acid transport system ATP-binding protein
VSAILSIESLTRHFGAIAAVNAVTLAVERQERRAIIGPNGAGKTTLFNLITGHLEPSGGRIVFEGRTITGLAPYQVARRGISRSFQRTSLFPRVSVLENLRLAAAASTPGSYDCFRSVSRLAGPLARARDVAAAVGLDERLDDVAASLSYGEQRQLEVGIALATSPALLLLDEPTAGMSPEETLRMTRLLAGLSRDVTLLIIEHDMDVVFSLADRITVLHYGEVLSEGPPDVVRADPRVYEVYLGTGEEPSSSGGGCRGGAAPAPPDRP